MSGHVILQLKLKSAGRFLPVIALLAGLFVARGAEPLAASNALKREKIRVTDRALAQQVLSDGGDLIGDYGSFQVFRVDPKLALELASHAAVEPENRENIITLNARHLDTSTEQLKSSRSPLPAGTGKRLHLVHFAGPVKPEWLAELQGSGAEIVTYIPHNAYLVYGNAGAIARLQVWAERAPHVQWDGGYFPDLKIHPHARVLDAKGNPQKPGTDMFAIQAVYDAEANPVTLQIIDRLKLEPIRKQTHVLNYLNVVARLPVERLQEIADQPDVISIQPYYERKKLDERQDQIVAGNLSGNGPASPGYLNWLTSKGFSQSQFNASSFSVDVTDSGIDNATTTPGHFGLYELGATNLSSRVIYNRLEGSPNVGSTRQGCDGHGNLNTHIIAGYNDRPNGFPHTDSLGFHYGLGVCPFVKVGSSVIFDPDKFTYPDYTDLASRAYHDGARVSNNSWGGDSFGDYDIDAQSYDFLVRDAQPSASVFPAAGNQEMIFVFAAGNSGPDAQTIGTPGTAKNVITVGAAENVRSHSTSNGGNTLLGSDGCDTTDAGADSANDIADFSSRGPCSDGRTKPDLVAPGTHVTGGVAQNSPAPPPSGTGSALACFRASGVCALPGGGTTGSPNNFFPLGQQFYTTSSGTSHSTPGVSGACALIRQYFINGGLPAPSAAMTKAFLMNSARYMNGIYANDSLWSPNQGMGELNLGFAFDGTARSLHDEVASETFTATGQARTFTGTITDPTKPFRVTLGWSDAPGNTTGNAFNNDLDLTVTVGGNIYKGNVFSGAYSITGGTADPRNNVESVFLPAGLSGNFVVSVTAANITSDGVPNVAPALDQDFALLIYNGLENVGPVLKGEGFAVTAESCNPTNASVDPAETVTLNLSLRNVGLSNTVDLIATLLESNGVSGASAPRAYGSLIAGGSAVSRPFTFTANGNCGDSILCTLQLQDTTNLGNVTFSIPLGQANAIFTQNFDSVTAPALPAGWTTTVSGGESPWITATGSSESPPNSAFSTNAASVGMNELVSPIIPVSSLGAQLAFRQNFNMENGFDGGVLEIKIGTGSFIDILSAGASFLSGGYTHTLSSSYGNPLGGRRAWSGTSGGYITTIVQLPAAAAGQNVQFRWRVGTDQSLASSGWYLDSVALNGRICCGTSLVVPPFIQPGAAVLLNEGCNPTNGAPDPGETVTYNFSLQNVGAGNSTNLVATLLATNGIAAPSGSQNFGALAAGGQIATKSFSFTVSGTCGDLINPTFQLNDGSQSLGVVSFNLQLGKFNTIFSENFDGVSAPALPGGWTTSGGGAQTAWSSTAATKDTSPNSVFSSEAASAGTNQLISPPISLPTNAVQISFRHSYNLESASSGVTAYDGGVLEIKIGAGAFVDIIGSGGSFLTGAYTHVISPAYGNPLPLRRAWSGNSGGFTTSTVLLPAAASGQSVQFRWRCATDSTTSGGGWNVDSVVVLARICCGEILAPVASFSADPTSGGAPLTVAFTDLSSGTITNRFWSFGNGATTNTTATNFRFPYGTVGTNSVSLTVSGPLGTNTLTRTNYLIVTNAINLMVSNSFTLLAESCTNGVIDPGETVTMSFGLRNIGTATASNVVATLLASGGITAPSSPVTFGTMSGGGAATTRSFSFIPSGSCGTSNIATLHLQDGTNNLGTVSFSFVLGQLSAAPFYTQRFDSITSPFLPAGWTTSITGASTNWITSTNEFDTPPNSAFGASATAAGISELISPGIVMPAGGVQLAFRHHYNMENTFDGGVLELKIGAGSFVDIVAAGGIFVTNGYNAVISTNYGSPIAGRAAWTGNSGGFLTSLVNLPAAVSGQSIQLRWRSASDNALSWTGWFVDGITLSAYACCANAPSIIQQPQKQVLLAGDTANFNVGAIGTAPLFYQWIFNGTNLTGATGAALSRTNVQVGDVGSYSVIITNPVGSILSTTAALRIVIQPGLATPQFTNSSFRFLLTGNGGYNYSIEGSTNLSNWSTITTVSNPSGTIQISDPSASNYIYRFYRVKLVP